MVSIIKKTHESISIKKSRIGVVFKFFLYKYLKELNMLNHYE